MNWIDKYNKTHNNEYFPYSILSGYIVIWRPNHRLSNTNGYVYVHRLEAEKLLGRELNESEVVHHKDENKLNNDLDNLMVFATTSDHTAFHNGCNIYCLNNIWYAEKLNRYNICPICNKNIKYYNSNMCINCSLFFRKEKSKCPTKEILMRLINCYSMLYIAKLYNVSDKTVVKWCKLYNLPYYKKDIEYFRNSNNIEAVIKPIEFNY